VIPFKVGDTVIFSDYDGMVKNFHDNGGGRLLAEPDDVMVVAMLWDVDQLLVECPAKWEGVLPSRFFKHAEGDV
jgi:hypothetical protein